MHGALPPLVHVLRGVELTTPVSLCGHIHHMLYGVDLYLGMHSFMLLQRCSGGFMSSGI